MWTSKNTSNLLHLVIRHYKRCSKLWNSQIISLWIKNIEILELPFLAHLSRRITWWAYSIPMVSRPSIRLRLSPLSVVIVHTFKLEYLWSQLANLDQILCVASLGWGKGCIRFWGRLDQNSGFHGNRKLPLTYNGENVVSTFSRLFLIRSFLYLQVTRTCIKSLTSSISARSDHWLRS